MNSERFLNNYVQHWKELWSINHRREVGQRRRKARTTQPLTTASKLTLAGKQSVIVNLPQAKFWSYQHFCRVNRRTLIIVDQTCRDITDQQKMNIINGKTYVIYISGCITMYDNERQLNFWRKLHYLILLRQIEHTYLPTDN